MYIKILGVPFKSQELWDYILFFSVFFSFFFFSYKMLLVSTESSLFYATDFDTELWVNYEYCLFACFGNQVVFFFSYSPNSLGFSWVKKMHIDAFKLFKPCRLLRLQVLHVTTKRECPLLLIALYTYCFNSALHKFTRKILVLHYTVSRIYTE